jgi:hypothetical protein
VGGGFSFILLHHLHHELIVAVHSGRQGKWTNTLWAGWGVAYEWLPVPAAQAAET